EPAGQSYDVGNMPLSAIFSPDGKIVMSLSGYREQGLQVFDPQSNQVVQSISQPSAFLGVVFSSDGQTLYASGANEDVIYIYGWNSGKAESTGKIILEPPPAEGKTPDVQRYPAGLALSSDNRYLYVAENISDTLAVVDLKSKTVVERYPAGHF